MKRAAFVLIAMLLAGLAPAQEDRRLKDLLQKLEDESIAVRSSAASGLATYGKSAIPLLRRAASESGSETRDRLAEVIRKIEERERLSALLPPASLITLDARNKPLREVFQRVARQSRTPIDLTDVPEDALVTVALDRVPFWRAVEEICRASGKVMATTESGHLGFSAEPYMALPGKTTEQFRATLQRIELSSNGTFGQPDRFESFNAVFHLCWEKGVRPWRVSGRILGLVDETGVDLIALAGDTETPVQTSPAPDSVHREFQLTYPRGPGPQAVRIGRLLVEFELEFPLRYAEVRLDVADGRMPAPGECPEFTARLNRLERQEASLLATLTLGFGAPPESEVLPESIILRDHKGVDHVAIITDAPPPAENEAVLQLAFPDVPEGEALKELVIRIPVEVHRERLEIDLKDIPLK